MNVDTQRWAWLILFGSSATWVCCALPILLVSLGLGAVSATLFANLPFLVTLAQHKLWLFVGSGIMLLASAIFLFRPGRACPTDPELAALCERSDQWNKRVWALSLVVWAVGFIAAYFALPLLEWWER